MEDTRKELDKLVSLRKEGIGEKSGWFDFTWVGKSNGTLVGYIHRCWIITICITNGLLLVLVGLDNDWDANKFVFVY